MKESSANGSTTSRMTLYDSLVIWLFVGIVRDRYSIYEYSRALLYFWLVRYTGSATAVIQVSSKLYYTRVQLDGSVNTSRTDVRYMVRLISKQLFIAF